MNPLEFKKKWGRYAGKETSGYQEHFNDLCRMLGQPTPAEADPSGEDFFCFQKRVVKDLELFTLSKPPSEAARRSPQGGKDGEGPGLSGFAVNEDRPGYGDEETERGFADVWKKGFFAWEYKGKKKNLDAAYQQLLRYRESLANPPLLVVCDFDRYVIRTNFNGTVQETIEFTNSDLDDPKVLHKLRCLFTNPDLLRPTRTTDRITEELAKQIAGVARSLQQRESVEYDDARTRAEVNVAVRKNLRVARFLNRITFCFFAEDVGLLPEGTFTDVTKAGLDDPHFFAERLQELFAAMAAGGSFGPRKIRPFNGHLFEEATVFELTAEEIRALADASESDWQHIEPSIFGTLFERALDESQRSQLGAHYTSKEDIETLVEPVLMDPLRREWAKLKGALAADYKKGRGTPEARKQLNGFLKKLRETVVLDPACGSGNFLYVALQKLLGLEKEVLAWSEQLGFKGGRPQVGVDQLRAIEINPYAYELAQVTVQIGWLQWLRDNGFELDRTPVLQSLEGFENADALLREVFKRKPKNLKAARQAEHETDADVKGYVERVWPECDVIVGNPPFLGGKMLRRELGDSYVDELFATFGSRVRPEADLCCYWFEKARAHVEDKRCRRAGLLATQGIRGGANRDVLQRIKETGDIFWAESDRAWVLAGANVHVSMVGFDDGTEQKRRLDGKPITSINAQLSARASVHEAAPLAENLGLSFMGITPAGPFDLEYDEGLPLLASPNPHRRPTSDVLRPYFNGKDLNQRAREAWTIDFGVETPEAEAANYAPAFQRLESTVKPVRVQNRREAYARYWWLYAESRPAMRETFKPLSRYLATCMVAKHRIFTWLPTVALPANVVICFARDDDYFFGVLHSRFHEVWALKQGTRLETRPRYTPTTCFETFAFPQPTPAQEAAIAAAAKELNQLRENWLNPSEWTRTEVLEFPGTVGGPWARFIGKTKDGEAAGREGRMDVRTSPPSLRPAPSPSAQSPIPPHSVVATVRYPRIVPRDADCAAKLKERTLTKLYNERPAWLEHAHRKLDEAVAAAYGLSADLSDEDILSRLLALNLERAAAEAKAAPTTRKAQRAKREDELL